MSDSEEPRVFQSVVFLKQTLIKQVMPYDSKSDLPDQVKDNLPAHGQEIYRKTFNNAWDQYSDPEDRKGNDSREEVAYQVAWDAVKQEYHKEDGNWKRDG